MNRKKKEDLKVWQNERVHEQKTEYRVSLEESRILELGQRSWLIRIMLVKFFNEIRSVPT